jgi:hypothetical protein
MGWRFRPHPRGLACLVLLTGLINACSERETPRDLDLHVGFVCEADRTDSEMLRLRVLAGDCATDARVLYEARLARGETPPPMEQLAPGEYGIEASSYGAEEALVAHACLEVSLPSAEALELELRSTTCSDDELDAEVDAGSPPEAGTPGLDAEREPGPELDTGLDAAPSVCTSDCSDSDPCTDDLCVAGACTHVPFSGARECDGIPCTQADTCASGECRPGTPNHASCPDDGNPCSAETCVVGAGCNRSNAPANGRSCDDRIACTSMDTCKDGLCSGVDACSNGQVCSAAQHICLACSGPQDCDDGNPCTNDTCSAGQCGHSNNTASCNDGKSCTGNDVCSAGKCAGTSTCPSDASCGGSTCTCSDNRETLCTGSNTCVNLSSTASDCGLCGRACSAGASCENGACKPSTATMCSAYRSGGHDYLICSDTLIWTAARDRCRSFGLVLAIVDNQSENDYLRDRLGGTPHWIGASDRGDNGNNCRLSAEEGNWYWANATSDNGLKLCTATSSGNVACPLEAGRYDNWFEGQPNNIYCDCNFNGCSEGQDCATMDGMGDWYDDQCSLNQGYVCETP